MSSIFASRENDPLYLYAGLVRVDGPAMVNTEQSALLLMVNVLVQILCAQTAWGRMISAALGLVTCFLLDRLWTEKD